MASFCRQTCYDEIRAGSNDRTVAAEARPDSKAPPERFKVGDACRTHILNHRNHRCNERNIVKECRYDCTEPENEERCIRKIATRYLKRDFRNATDDTRLDQTANRNEETDEKKRSLPILLFRAFFP